MTDHDHDELETRIANALDVPEPSPLFWEHFPGRVRAAVAASPAATPVPWWKRRAFALALSVALIAGLSSWAYRSARGTEERAEPVATVANTDPIAPSDDAGAGGEDAGWEVVTSVAASAGIERLREAGFGVSPGDAEAAIDDMTEAERAELVALLRAEMSGDSGGL